MKSKTLILLLFISWICNSQTIKHNVKKSRLFKEVYERTILVKRVSDGKGGTFTVRKYNEYIVYT